MNAVKAVVGARVSHVQGPEKVSHIAQHATGTKWAEDNNATVVGTFQDLDVSATVSPFDRPDLGKWFKVDLRDTWDCMVFSKVDRAFRSISDSVEVAKWFREHGKMLVFAEDGLKLDYRPGVASASFEGMMAELFVYLGGFFGELELSRFRTRAKDAHAVLLQTDRWPSGNPPLGFRIVDHPSGKGKALDTDPHDKEILRDMAGKLLSGWSMSSIADHLNRTGVRSSFHLAKLAAGKKLSETPWSNSTVKRALTSPKTQGLKVSEHGKSTRHQATPVLTAEGIPIRVAPPTFDNETWDQIQAKVAERSALPRSKTVSHNKYLGIGYCSCGASLSQKFDRRIRKSGAVGDITYFMCGRTPKSCRNTLIRVELLDQFVEENFLSYFGDLEVTKREFVPGEDFSGELRIVNDAIARLRRESDAGLVDNEDDYLSRLSVLTARRRDLESKPSRAAGWVNTPTGRTYREIWQDKDRQEILKDAGVSFELVTSKPLYINFKVFPPTEDLDNRLTAVQESQRVDPKSWDGEKFTRTVADGWDFTADDNGDETWFRL